MNAHLPAWAAADGISYESHECIPGSYFAVELSIINVKAVLACWIECIRSYLFDQPAFSCGNNSTCYRGKLVFCVYYALVLF